MQNDLKNKISLLLIISATVLLGYFAHTKLINQDFFNINKFKLTRPVIILLAASDQEYDKKSYNYKVKVKNSFHGRTDTIIVAKFDPVTGKISALNIPRDTRIYLNGKTPDRINALNTIGGIALLEKVLEDLFEIKIDYHMLVNSSCVEKIIDLVGGIELDVPRDMRYQDKTDGINIDLKAGIQVLNGKESVGFLRFRNTALGDIERIQRQQIFMRAVQDKMKNPFIFTKATQIIPLVIESTETNMDMWDILKLANFAKEINRENMVFATLPGTFSVPEEPIVIELPEIQETQETQENNSENNPEFSPETEHKKIIIKKQFVSYWLPDEIEIKKLCEKLFFTHEYNKKYKNINNKNSVELENINKNLKIHIKNMTSDQDLASKFSENLLDNNFYVVKIDNLDDKEKLEKIFPENIRNFSKIYYQKANRTDAIFLKNKLSMPESTELFGGNIGIPDADLVVFLGEDMKN